MSIVKEFLS